MLKPLDVIVIFDGLVQPPHPKLVICVHPADGIFYRINSRPFLKPHIFLQKDPLHPWLDHDSYMHIDPIVLDDYIVGEAIRRHGVIGTIDSGLIRQIKRMTLDVPYMTLLEKQAICDCLRTE